ncbi:MAG: GAF domain-containing protein [Anaerolineae bacterium]|nr:GAF domain-containing protein [Anaerolineae bacterium]
MLPNLNADRILVVEDDLKVADHLSNVLRNAGYDVHNAYTCGDAVATDHARYKLALVDGGMHDRGGRSVYDYINQSASFSKLPIVTIHHEGQTGEVFFPLKSPQDEGNLLLYVDQIVKNPHDTALPATLTGRSKSEETLVEVPRKQQLIALKTLSDLGRSISSVLDLTEVLNKVVEAAVALTRAEEGLLLLPDEDGKTLYLRAMKGLDDENASNFRIKNQNSLVGQVFQTGRPILVGDSGPQQIRTQYFVKSLLYVPMIYKREIVGVLGVNTKRVNRVFTLNDQELLLDLAAHAAIAIENARLYEERLEQNRQLTTLVEAGKAVNSTLTFGKVLTGICEQIMQAINLNGCQILQRQPDNSLRSIAQTWRALWPLNEGIQAPLESRPVLKKALEQAAFFIVSYDQTGEKWALERERLNQEGAEQMLMLPLKPPTTLLKSESKPLAGFVELYYRGTMPEVNSNFRHQVRERAYQAATLIVDGQQSMSTSAVWDSAEQIIRASGADWLKLWLVNGGTATRIAEYGTAIYLNELGPYGMLRSPDTAILDDSKLATYHVLDANIPRETRDVMQSYGAKMMLCVPLYVKGDLFGVVAGYSTQETRHFRPDEMRLVLGLVTQAATAIDNARLYSDLQRSLEELKRAQAKLVDTARLSAIGELAAVVAHQINNPLTTVIADAELLLQDLPENDPKREGVMAINRAGRRSLAVVKRLLSNARRESGEQEYPTDVHETIRNTLELVSTYIERKGIVIESHLYQDATPIYVMAKLGHLEDVWLNLVMNARDALESTPDARIVLSTRIVGKSVEVTVRDNGPGIPAEHMDRIFNPFFTTKPLGEGTGLGLYICKQISEECDGTIILDQSVKPGACFRVSLPVAVPEAIAT